MAVELGGKRGAEAEREQGVENLVRVGADRGGLGTDLGDEVVEALAQVGGVGGFADEREQGLAEAPFQGSPPFGVPSRRVASAGS